MFMLKVDSIWDLGCFWWEFSFSPKNVSLPHFPVSSLTPFPYRKLHKADSRPTQRSHPYRDILMGSYISETSQKIFWFFSDLFSWFGIFRRCRWRGEKSPVRNTRPPSTAQKRKKQIHVPGGAFSASSLFTSSAGRIPKARERDVNGVL